MGRAAETVAASWLEKKGYRLLDRNWRNRWCEIDIVACRSSMIHIIEVKYRRRSDQGTGFEHISTQKMQRLRRAAVMWLTSTGHGGSSYQIDVMSISGYPEPKFVEYLPNAISF
jgi:putative endonuclease